ncbi:MAG: class I SAM-dependent methyltransferase [Limisphaerales bacterium]
MFALVLAADAADDSSSLPGTYRNLGFNVDGAGGAQRLMAPLVLLPDHTYTWSKEKGHWDLVNEKLRLSERPAWGDAAVNRDRQLIFEFTRDNKHFTVTMYRAGDAPGSASAATARSVAPGPVVSEVHPRYETRADHDPNGTGVFYLGREIAQVMGHQGASWLERPERAEEERPDLLLEDLALRPGEVAADIGAGTGYLTRRMARQVGDTGRVYAVDIQPEMLDLLAKNMTEQKINNVKTVLGTITDPKLPPRSVDLVVMVDVYHEFSNPHEMMTNICRALKPGGRVVFVEYRAEDPAVPIKLVHKMSEAQVRKEAEVLPLEWVNTLTNLPRQHVIVFRKKGK